MSSPSLSSFLISPSLPLSLPPSLPPSLSPSLPLSQPPVLDPFTQTPLMDYHVEYSEQRDFTNAVTIMVSYLATTTTTSSTLNKGTQYFFRVSVSNSAGSSPFSDTAMGRTAVDCKNTPPSTALIDL